MDLDLKDFTDAEWLEMVEAIDRFSVRNGYRIVMPGEQLSLREQNLLREELRMPTLADTEPSRSIEEVGREIGQEFDRRRREPRPIGGRNG